MPIITRVFDSLLTKGAKNIITIPKGGLMIDTYKNIKYTITEDSNNIFIEFITDPYVVYNKPSGGLAIKPNTHKAYLDQQLETSYTS